VPRYKLFLCHTPIKPDLLGIPGIGVFAFGLRDHVITRFASIFLSIICDINKLLFKLVVFIITSTFKLN